MGSCSDRLKLILLLGAVAEWVSRTGVSLPTTAFVNMADFLRLTPQVAFAPRTDLRLLQHIALPCLASPRAYWTLNSRCCRFEVCGRTSLGHRPRSTASAHSGLPGPAD